MKKIKNKINELMNSKYEIIYYNMERDFLNSIECDNNYLEKKRYYSLIKYHHELRSYLYFMVSCECIDLNEYQHLMEHLEKLYGFYQNKLNEKYSKYYTILKERNIKIKKGF